MIRGYSSLVRSAVVSAPPGRYEENPLQFIPLVTQSNHLKCTIESDSSWLHLLVGTPNQLVSLRVRSRATQRCPRAVYRRERQGGYDRHYWRAWPLLVSRESYQTTKSRALPRAHTRQGKETVHLVGNRRDLVGRQGKHHCTCGLGCCRCLRVS